MSSTHVLPLLRWLFLGIALSILLSPSGTWAHETRPAYLEINENAPERYDVLWRTPVLAGMRLPLALRFAEGAHDVTAPAVREFPDSLVERRVVEVPGGLAGQRIDIDGLRGSITDVLARVQLLDGMSTTTLIRPSQPWLEVMAARGWFEDAGTYLRYGVEHILLGYDHLLFVFALILIVRQARVLLWTITAFTLAHSITLALSTLGLVHVPRPPVEAVIALSIVLLAGEIVRYERGKAGLTSRWPWAVACAFGLLHGFGFASALAEIGLPRSDIPLALFAFNLGVELGQIAFIAVVLALFALGKRIVLAVPLEPYARPVASYAIGILASFWFFERLTGF